MDFEDAFDDDIDEAFLAAVDAVEATQRPAKRARLEDQDVDAMRAELARLQGIAEAAEAAAAKATKELQTRDGEVAHMRRAKGTEEAKARDLLAKQRERNQHLEQTIAEMKRNFKADLEKQATARIFEKQEMEAAARKFKVAAPSPAPSPSKQAPRYRSPVVTRIQPKKAAAEAFAGFVNSFETSAVKTEVESPVKSLNGNHYDQQDMEMQPLEDVAESSMLQPLPPAVTTSTKASLSPTKDKILLLVLNHHYVSPVDERAPVSNTLYSLMNCPLPDIAPGDRAIKDRLAAELFSDLSFAAVIDEDAGIPKVADGLAALAAWFTEQQQLLPLAKTLALIASLCLFFPPICQAYLAEPALQSKDLLNILNSAVTDHCTPMQTQLTVKGKEREVDPHASEREAVVLAALDVLNALTFRIRQEDVHRIEQLLTTGQPILMTLTEHRNSPRILTSTVEWALLLVSEPSFFRTLLSLASPSQPAQAHGIASRIPLVDRLASLLAFQHSDYSFEATVALHLNVLDVLGALSLAHTDAITLMGESANLIPKMIACISADTTILYESDGQGLAALFPKLIIRRCATCLRLMLLLSSSATFRPKLHAAMPFYNGIMQMFTVAVGRLGASEAPPWLSEERQRDVDGLAECAQMLLDWVLSPEEVDAIWALYDSPEDDEDTQETDEALMIADQQINDLEDQQMSELVMEN